MQNNSAVASHESIQPEAPLRRELRRRLLALPYRAFLQVAVHLLKEQGYTAARPTGRDQWKGRNTAGGWDAEADFQAGALGTLRCIAQVKQFDTLVVAQRQVDELRGTCLRAGAHQALLITLSSFSPPARKAAQANVSVAPVRLIDGEELLDMLIAARLGIGRRGSGTWALDEDYFAALWETAGSKAAPYPGAGERSFPQSVSITIRLRPPKSIPDWESWQWEPDMGSGLDAHGEPL